MKLSQIKCFKKKRQNDADMSFNINLNDSKVHNNSFSQSKYNNNLDNSPNGNNLSTGSPIVVPQKNKKEIKAKKDKEKKRKIIKVCKSIFEFCFWISFL